MKKRLLITALLWVALILVSACVGRYPLSLEDIFLIITGRHESATAVSLFWEIRLPRVLLVAYGGGALAVSGAVFQTLFSNPLVSPDVLGVTSGCSVGAVFAMLFLPSAMWAVHGSAFVFGLLVVAFALFLSSFVKSNRILGMVLAGIIVSSAASAVLMIFKMVADPLNQLPAIEYWLMGGFQNSTNSKLILVVSITIIPLILMYLLRYRLKVLSLGDEQAQSLGISPLKTRIFFIVLATLPVSAVVSVAGVVSWIGLIAPHIVRLCISRDISKNMGAVFFTGGVLLMAADLFARNISGLELPISIFTSLFGSVFLTFLLIRRFFDKKGGNRL